MSDPTWVVMDLETYPGCIIAVAMIAGTEITFTFEISRYRDDSGSLYTFLCWMRDNNAVACGFNFVNFDGPIIHLFMKMNGKASADTLYDKAMAIIKAQDDDKFAHQVYPSDRDFRWCCLYKINHYDNRAKTTSLKHLNSR